jgi:hypothetical protein
VLEELPVQRFRYIYVVDGTTGLAYKVNVGIDLRLVSVKGATKIEALHHPLFHENVEIPVYVAQREAGKLLFQLVVDPVSRRMGAGVLENLEDAVTLFALAKFFLGH